MPGFLRGDRPSAGIGGECRFYSYDTFVCYGSNARGAGAAYGKAPTTKKRPAGRFGFAAGDPGGWHPGGAQLKNSFALSNQPLSVGLCLSPPFLSDSSSSFISLRWCSVSLTGVSTRTWQYRSPG